MLLADGGETSDSFFGDNVHFGETEVEDFGVPAVGDEQIRWLNIAMNNSLGVGSIKRVGNFDGEIQQSLGFEVPANNYLAKRLALEKLHDDERAPLILADLVNGTDIRMIQR